jgi:tetratricopeptide (TPR) repeat protein
MIERLLAGESALARDDLEIADRLFRQVAEADPRNAIAVVGLARIALRRGDQEGARELAVRALSIDPDEAAASRLLVKLDRDAEEERQLEPALNAKPPPTPEPTPGETPAWEPEPAPEVERLPGPLLAARGWRAWLARLLRRG